jgi:NAD(P)-dependent dehydrogenase (short-subunit alcohol dehydrogenase family)
LLTNKFVLITGGLGRLGLALATTVEEYGGTPVLTSRDQEKADDFNQKAENRKSNARVRLLKPDNEHEVKNFIEQLVKEYPRIDGLVNNAYPHLSYQGVEEVSWDHWIESSRIALGLPLTLSTELMSNQTGLNSIVNMSSMYGVVAPSFNMYSEGKLPSTIYYGTMKAALIQQTRYLAAYLGNKGIRVNAVSPGGVFDNQDDEFLKRYNATVPMKRMVTREEVAATVCFLLGDESSGITGENIVIDGGRTII